MPNHMLIETLSNEKYVENLMKHTICVDNTPSVHEKEVAAEHLEPCRETSIWRRSAWRSWRTSWSSLWFFLLVLKARAVWWKRRTVRWEARTIRFRILRVQCKC